MLDQAYRTLLFACLALATSLGPAPASLLAQGSLKTSLARLRPLRCPDFREAIGGVAELRVALTGGPAWDARTLTPRTDDRATRDYARRRTHSRVLLPSTSAQLRVERDVAGRLYGAVGLGYDLYVSKVDVRTGSGEERLASRPRVHAVTPAGLLGYRRVVGEQGAAVYGATELGYEFFLSAAGEVIAPSGDEAPLPFALGETVSARPGLRYGGRVGVSVPFAPGAALAGELHYRLGGQAAGPTDLVDYRYRRFGASLGVSWGL